LEVWQAARELGKEIHRLVQALLDFEKFVSGPVRRASAFVTANLAESSGVLVIRKMPSFADKLLEEVI
jgi:hypothetical protein